MAQKMCKFSCCAIEESMGAIYSIVAEPKFVCRSCARVAASSSNLCKPSPIPPKACRSKVFGENSPEAEECMLLVEAAETNVLADEDLEQPCALPETTVAPCTFNEPDTSALRLIKKQKKLLKKLSKVLEKEQELLEKRAKLQGKLQKLLEATDSSIASD